MSVDKEVYKTQSRQPTLSLVVTGEWRVIPDHPEYEVSNLGQVRNAQSKRVLRPFLNERGYLKVKLGFSGNNEAFFIHRLVLSTFGEPCPEGLECGHLNGVRTDNRLDNLAWVTREENAAHKVLHGTARRDKPGVVKLNPEIVRSIRSRYRKLDRPIGRTSDNKKELAKEYGLHVSSIVQIVKRKTWKDV